MNYKLIYVMAIDDEAHRGLLKIGEASVSSNLPIDSLHPNCKLLNEAAKKRIDEYTGTAGVSYRLLHTELAVRQIVDQDGKIVTEGFRDTKVHDVLKHSGISNVKIEDTKGSEWFPVDLDTAVAAIRAYKENKGNLSGAHNGSERLPIIFRAEQKEAIKKTVDRFKKHDRYLWNAKMRFGKTLSALEVVKKCGFAKTIILTHRPVVDDGWYEDFNKIFDENDGYVYGSRNRWALSDLLKSGNKFIYFASIQDLRGSKRVGSKFDKNDLVFDTVWDLVIVDEAHEGTTTALGDTTISAVVKEGGPTKLLALSGTPFNIISDYSDEEVFTWDYVMEQEAKSKWDECNFGDHNPYSDLPELKIYTYSLGDILSNSTSYITFEDKAFNFREFFRTWQGDASVDHDRMPDTAKVGDFVHEKDVQSFLNLLTLKSDTSEYPFSTSEYRDLFRHTFWVVPGVREALALQRLLEKHAVFGGNAFNIINVAGDGDPNDPNEEALKSVKKGIKDAGEDGYTITLSCGKLTTGVTVKEWTGVFMLSGSYSTSASSYLQTIFRVQSPCSKYGKVKEACYVFDFAPDRTLKMVSTAASISSKKNGAKSTDRVVLGKFLNYCPVISISGSEMEKLDAPKFLQRLKKAYADRVVSNGFEDTCLYNNELLKLTDFEIEKFNNLKRVIGASKASKKIKEIIVNDQGLLGEEYEEQPDTSPRSKSKKVLTKEQKEAEEKKKQRANAIAILTQISVRMPLLIYGANVDYSEDISLDKFVEMVDPQSWEEFMPKGVTKEVFKEFQKYYDEEVFIAAGRHIRNIAKHADTLEPTERVQTIAKLFSNFKNPDKETVLTPWRVVNMHMSDTLGGWCFWDESFEKPVDQPRFVDRGEVTACVFGDEDSRVLEINSKTGLYPLYVAYSAYRTKLALFGDEELSFADKQELWNEAVTENVFVICKTEMAKAITQRTLCGFSDCKINAHYFEDLINQLQNKPQQFVGKVLKESYWKKGNGVMEFSAVVSNPPYQLSDGGAQASAKPIYHLFVEQAIKLNPNYISFIMPARWFTGGKGLDNFRDAMIHDTRMKVLHDFADCSECFTNVEIKGGVCYFLWDRDYDGECDISRHDFTGVQHSKRYLVDGDDDIFIRDARLLGIKHKVIARNEGSVTEIVSARKPYGLTADSMRNASKYGLPEFSNTEIDGGYKILGLGEKSKRCWKYIPKDYPLPKKDGLDKYKVFVPEAYGCGEIGEVPSTPVLGTPGELCTETFLQIGPFETKTEAENFLTYLRTKFFRALVGIKKQTQHTTQKVYAFIPMQDFSKPWTDVELYAKYGLSEEEIEFIESAVKGME